MLLAKHDFGLLDLHFSRLWILAISRLTMSYHSHIFTPWLHDI